MLMLTSAAQAAFPTHTLRMNGRKLCTHLQMLYCVCGVSRTLQLLHASAAADASVELDR